MTAAIILIIVSLICVASGFLAGHYSGRCAELKNKLQRQATFNELYKDLFE